ncbi:COG3698 Predicted periplasmic protein [Methylophilaceae bacterium]
MLRINLTLILLFTALTVNANPNFIDFNVDSKVHNIKLYLKDENGQGFGQFNSLAKHLKTKNEKLVFAMNAGMFMENLMPLGLYIENGKLVQKINLRTKAHGNFYMQPNGIFSLTKKGAQINETHKFKNNDVLFATQSGPMLLINSKLNRSIKKESISRLIRNGVCIDKSKHVIFSISSKPVSFFEMAQHFKDELSCENALYLDGVISQIYWPKINRFGLRSDIGPMIGVTLVKEM